MKSRLLLTILAACVFSLVPAFAEEKPRLIVLTDIGGDPDDTQSLIRLMTYANEFDIEGLIASAAGTPGELKQEITRPELIRGVVEAYGQVRSNLLLHHPDYPDARQLLDRVKSGNPRRGLTAIGEQHDTDGSRSIIAAVDRPDPRPLNVTIWGGQTDLAQALWRVRNDREPDGLKRFLEKLRVYDINDQDKIAGWITENFPDLFYILASAGPGRDKREGAYRGMYLGGDESLTSREWVDRSVRLDRGPLGALYPTRTWTAPNPHATLKEGDTPSWFYFLPIGLGDPAHPEWGGWGGRFQKVKNQFYRDAVDTVNGISEARATVWRWRPAFQADFQARMEWCVKPATEANHPPRPVLNADKTLRAMELTVRPGSKVKLSAAGSTDPDGDSLSFRWYVYPEAGTYGQPIPVVDATSETAMLTVPADAAGRTIHVILEVSDDGTPSLTRYRRAVLTIEP
jgi:hypothetical protein